MTEGHNEEMRRKSRLVSEVEARIQREFLKPLLDKAMKLAEASIDEEEEGGRSVPIGTPMPDEARPG